MRLYQRGKRKIWWVDFTIPGRPRFTRSSGTTDQRKAKEWAASAQASAWRQEKLGQRPEYTWGQAVADWLKKHAHERRSIETMKERLRWITRRLEDTPLHLITRTSVEALMEEKAAEGVKGRSKSATKPRPIAPKTLNNYVCEIAKILNHARVIGWIDAVPPLRQYKVPKPPVVWLTHDQADRLLFELPPHLAAMARFALATGLRESNVRLLRWDHVDLKSSHAWVDAQDAKAEKPISVDLNVDAISVLIGQTGIHEEWVFPFKGQPIVSCSSAAWYRATKRADVPNLRWHDLRHTWASWHVQAGTPLPVLQAMGGWSSLTMVQRYAHLGRAHTAAYANAIVRDNGATSAQSRSVDDRKSLIIGVADGTRTHDNRDHKFFDDLQRLESERRARPKEAESRIAAAHARHTAMTAWHDAVTRSVDGAPHSLGRHSPRGRHANGGSPLGR